MKITNTFFNKLNRDIANSQTLKNLKLQEKRVKKFMESINNPMIDSKTKALARKKYKIALKKIKARRKQLN